MDYHTDRDLGDKTRDLDPFLAERPYSPEFVAGCLHADTVTIGQRERCLSCDGSRAVRP